MTERDIQELRREIAGHEREAKAISTAMEAQWLEGERKLERLESVLAEKRELLRTVAPRLVQEQGAPDAPPVNRRGRPRKAQ